MATCTGHDGMCAIKLEIRQVMVEHQGRKLVLLEIPTLVFGMAIGTLRVLHNWAFAVKTLASRNIGLDRFVAIAAQRTLCRFLEGLVARAAIRFQFAVGSGQKIRLHKAFHCVLGTPGPRNQKQDHRKRCDGCQNVAKACT